eukprot:4915352-Lingulodinium_polyedra.AAC.1
MSYAQHIIRRYTLESMLSYGSYASPLKMPGLPRFAAPFGRVCLSGAARAVALSWFVVRT